jgi:hypothetical protein
VWKPQKWPGGRDFSRTRLSTEMISTWIIHSSGICNHKLVAVFHFLFSKIVFTQPGRQADIETKN